MDYFTERDDADDNYVMTMEETGYNKNATDKRHKIADGADANR